MLVLQTPGPVGVQAGTKAVAVPRRVERRRIVFLTVIMSMSGGA